MTASGQVMGRWRAFVIINTGHMPTATSLEKEAQDSPDAPALGQGEWIELRQHPRGKTRDVQQVSSNSRSPKPSSAEKLYSEGLLVHPGALKHSGFGIESPQRNSGIPG